MMIAGIVLAAGSSTRLGRAKQLLPLGDRTVIEHVVDRMLASPLDRVMVVTGHQAADIAGVLRTRDLEIVVNPDYRQGQSTSLNIAIRRLLGDPQCEAAVVVLGDQPGIALADIASVVETWKASRPLIVMTQYGETRSHPVLFSREVFPELLDIEGDRGARDVIRRHRDEVVTASSVLDDSPADIDTEDAYESLRKSWKSAPPNVIQGEAKNPPAKHN